METLYMKIHSYEENSCSLIVSFASDTTKSQNPDDYTKQAFQPMKMWPDVSDPEEIKKRIAVIGVHTVKMQKIEENFVQNDTAIDQYKNMIGQQISYAISDLIPQPPQPQGDLLIPEMPIQRV